MKASSLTRSTFLLAIWLVLTAVIAFVVARQTVDRASDNVLAPIPVIGLDQRPLVTIAEVTIIPVVAAQGSVSLDGEQWLLTASIQPADVAYHLLETPVGIKARIDGGPSGFDCEWIGLGRSPEGGVAASCRIPETVKVAEGMTGTMVIQLSESQRVSGLPITAVLGSEGMGQVIVVTNGARELRTVTIGTHDDMHVEIVSGLVPGEEVLEFPTQLDVNAALSQ